jgi:hypothetical protein
VFVVVDEVFVLDDEPSEQAVAPSKSAASRPTTRRPDQGSPCKGKTFTKI